MLRRQGAVVFIDEKAKVNAKYYEESLLPSLVADCSAMLPGGFIFQQDTLAHTARLTQDWIAANVQSSPVKIDGPQILRT